MKPLASLLFVAVIISGVSSRCPQHWTYFQGDCYRYGDKTMSWLDAQTICQTRGAKLAEVSSPQENDFLRSIAREKGALCVWLGGDDLFREGTWEWASTSNTVNGYTNWADGEPDNMSNDQDCLNLYRPFNYTWDDGPCNMGCNFICSRPDQQDSKHPYFPQQASNDIANYNY